MKKLVIFLVFLMVCNVYAQTGEKETLKQINQNVISLYQTQKLDEALKFALQSIDLSLKIYGAEQLETAVAYTNAGVIYRDKRKFKESIENLQKSADIYLKIPNFKGEQPIAAHEALAYSQILGGKTKEAELSYLKAIQIAENRFGIQTKQGFSPTLNLANFYAREGRFDEADKVYLKTYALAIKIFGKDSKEKDQIGDSRSCIFSGRKEDDKKEKAYRDAVDELLGIDEAEKNRTVKGKALSLPKPRFPAEAHSKGLGGVASVKVKISEQGNVVEAKSICRNDILGEVAEETALKSKFEPTTKDGKPVIVTRIIVYNFVP